PATAKEAAEAEFTSETKIEDLKLRLMEMQDSLKSVLEGASGELDGDASAERLTEIKNSVASLEKDLLNLGSTITKEDRPGDEELPLEGVLPPKEDHKKK
ncbi:MAG: hypothetical protein K5981_06920, partial [Clostridia bacterium]|nr:hypothetical protein [Clostridia bacterium]